MTEELNQEPEGSEEQNLSQPVAEPAEAPEAPAEAVEVTPEPAGGPEESAPDVVSAPSVESQPEVAETESVDPANDPETQPETNGHPMRTGSGFRPRHQR